MKQIWNDIHGEVHPHTALDFLPKEQLRALQSQRLKEITKLAYDNVELFRNRMKRKGVLFFFCSYLRTKNSVKAGEC